MSGSEERRYRSRGNRGRQLEDFDEAPPARGVLNALVIGVIAACLCVGLNVVLTLLSAPAFAASARESEATINSYILLGIACLNFFVTLLACFLAGFITGKTTIQRRLGFYAGAVVGAITYVASALVIYIPGYPVKPGGGTAITGAIVTGGIVAVVVLLLIWGFIGGLMGLWGSWAATRKHPYYETRPKEK